MQHITPCLWFDNQAEDAVRFYTAIFKDARLLKISYYGSEGQEIHGQPEGSIMTVEFELAGQQFTALNGGPKFNFNEAISLQVQCETQAEVDYYWQRLTEGGDETAQQCGWLKDKYGVSWQVVPSVVSTLLSDKNRQKSSRVMRALLQMKKIDIAELQHVYDQRDDGRE